MTPSPDHPKVLFSGTGRLTLRAFSPPARGRTGDRRGYYQSMHAAHSIDFRLAEGLYTSEALFYTEHFVIRAQVVTPERRLSDYLNSSLPSAEIRPRGVHRVLTGNGVDLSNSRASITKAHLLFVIPVAEPEPLSVEGARATSFTVPRRCWAAFGRYALKGRIHVDPQRETRLILRSLESSQFVPFTDVSITYPDGQTHEYSTVIVNRAHLEIFALEEAD